MYYGQDIDITNTGPIFKSLAILYKDNLPTDPEFQDDLFFPISLLEVEKFLNSNAQNITCSLFRIGIFIKQYHLDNKQVSDFLELADIGTVTWYLINTIYKSK